ncbi:hypothetical protein BP5796_02466 [Coleophoma crateriformis]|uniref:DNA replication checkpoint mediator MRC1 domain-containing protein n=1 Tax=Coleophoma crateriformis TaxID=565419 RepID=A0A3D8SYQ8_9HELO|nr:hypothetical protein BP5796_02466 [Coleophoma crateriformis]
MASTRESTPAGDSGPPSPSQLTPNSKVKAMLAALDESDDDAISGKAAAKLSAATRKDTSSKPADSRRSSPRAERMEDSAHSTGQVDSDSNEDDEDIVRPKGRLAAQMLAADESSEEEINTAVTARDRVRQLLARKSKSPEPAAKASTDDSDEEDAPVQPRKRKVQRARSSTPISVLRQQSASPGLFVSPNSQRSASPPANESNSDSDDLPDEPLQDSRFLALVAKKRQERMEKDAELKRQKAKKAAENQKLAATMMEDEEMDDSDDNVERRLTQTQRPTRKAGKKALEEMHRETQRLSRSMQLAHQAKTKKKITKASLFAKFNYKPAGFSEADAESSAPTSSSPVHSDVEMRDTPPTSPASHANDVEKSTISLEAQSVETALHMSDHDEPQPLKEGLTVPSSPPAAIGEGYSVVMEAPDMITPSKADKGKGKAIESIPASAFQDKKPLFKQRRFRVQPPKVPNWNGLLSDSDSDIEIVNSKTPRKQRMDAIFDRVPEKKSSEASSLHALRMLAHLTSPGKQNIGKNKKPSMTTVELQMSLQQRARQQAAREREERLQALREKGVIVQTAEERQKELAEVEDLIARARREGEEIMRREKEAAKRARKARGEADPLDGSTDDEEWKEDEQKDPETLSASGSGSGNDEDLSGEEASDEEDLEEDDEVASVAEGDDTTVLNPLFDVEAESSEEEATAPSNHDEAEDEDEDLPVRTVTRPARKSNVISDDEDDVEAMVQSPNASVMNTPTHAALPVQPRTASPAAPHSVLRSATKTFIPGLTVAGPAGLGLTQIFAGTMDESQMDESPTFNRAEAQQNAKNSMAFLRQLPPPTLPPFEATLVQASQDMVMDSQAHVTESQTMETQAETQRISLDFSQSQIHGFDSLVHDPFATQISDFTETQDIGFQHTTPIKTRFMELPPSTVDTVLLESKTMPDIVAESPVAKKKGKLRRRVATAAFSDDDDDAAATEHVESMVADEDDFEISENVFDIMRKASKKKPAVADDFDRKKSKAKEMVNEQAEESEDEYAGLGGNSDDESGGEEDEYVKEMIDDAIGKDGDASKLAAFYADRERANDEKAVEKLYNDITKGMLRRKRGADYDLSDSDDGGEAKRRMKRREFAKMRKALLADERIGKIAENPKKQAFLRAIEDRGSEDEMDFLDDFAEPDETIESQSQSQSQAEGSEQIIPDSQTDTSMGPPKRKNSDDPYTESRPPPNLRRTQPNKKPANLSEIRESLSSLIEEPNSMIVAEDSGSDSELEIEGEPDKDSFKGKEKENRDPFALRRKDVPVIDRISLKRASSSGLTANTRLAFSVSNSAPGFKVPPLLRRATTNSSIASSTSSSVSGGIASATERMAGGAGSEGGVKRGGGKNSGVNYFARETERKAKLMKTEKKREQKRFKGAEVRGKVVGGLFGGGKFE